MNLSEYFAQRRYREAQEYASRLSDLRRGGRRATYQGSNLNDGSANTRTAQCQRDRTRVLSGGFGRGSGLSRGQDSIPPGKLPDNLPPPPPTKLNYRFLIAGFWYPNEGDEIVNVFSILGSRTRWIDPRPLDQATSGSEVVDQNLLTATDGIRFVTEVSWFLSDLDPLTPRPDVILGDLTTSIPFPENETKSQIWADTSANWFGRLALAPFVDLGIEYQGATFNCLWETRIVGFSNVLATFSLSFSLAWPDFAHTYRFDLAWYANRRVDGGDAIG